MKTLEESLLAIGGNSDKIYFDTSATNVQNGSGGFSSLVLSITSIDQFIEEDLENVTKFCDMTIAFFENFDKVKSIEEVVHEVHNQFLNFKSKQEQLHRTNGKADKYFNDPILGRVSYKRIFDEYLESIKLIYDYLNLRKVSFSDDPVASDLYAIINLLNEKYRFDLKSKAAVKNLGNHFAKPKNVFNTDLKLFSVALADALRGEKVTLITQDSDYANISRGFYNFLSSKEFYIPPRLIKTADNCNLNIFNNAFLTEHNFQEAPRRDIDFSLLNGESSKFIKNKLHKLLIYI